MQRAELLSGLLSPLYGGVSPVTHVRAILLDIPKRKKRVNVDRGKFVRREMAKIIRVTN